MGIRVNTRTPAFDRPVRVIDEGGLPRVEWFIWARRRPDHPNDRPVRAIDRFHRAGQFTRARFASDLRPITNDKKARSKLGFLTDIAILLTKRAFNNPRP